MQNITQIMKKFFITLVIVLGVFIASYAFATLGGPTQNPPAGNRSPFLNTGPITQVKEGKLDIGSSSPASVAFSVDGGVANLIGGINVNNSGGPAATIDAPMYVGYSGAGITGTPATLEINSQLRVSGQIRDTSLAHAMGAAQPVCADTNGVLITCAATPTCSPIAQAPTPCSFNDDPNASSPDSASCGSIRNTANMRVAKYEIVNQTGFTYTSTPPSNTDNGPIGFNNPYLYDGAGGVGTDFENLAPFRMRAVDGACVGPWSVWFGPGSSGPINN